MIGQTLDFKHGPLGLRFRSARYCLKIRVGFAGCGGGQVGPLAKPGSDQTRPDRTGSDWIGLDWIDKTWTGSCSVAKSGYCSIRRDWSKVKNCHQFSCLKKKTIVYAVNSLIEVNLSHRIFHNSALESLRKNILTSLNK